jgi:hypothetical protein
VVVLGATLMMTKHFRLLHIATTYRFFKRAVEEPLQIDGVVLLPDDDACSKVAEVDEIILVLTTS